MGNYPIVDGLPRNPVGRTGICGRGLLGLNFNLSLLNCLSLKFLTKNFLNKREMGAKSWLVLKKKIIY